MNKDNNGKIVSHTEKEIDKALFDNVNAVNEEDLDTGWIYIFKSKISHKEISSINNLYKIAIIFDIMLNNRKNGYIENTVYKPQLA